MHTRLFLPLPLLAAFVLLPSCKKDKPEPAADQPVVVGATGGVYIANEGNFQFGNSKVSYYNIASGSAVEDLYQPANGVALGDVCQSMSLFNGKGYVVVNNSGKVVVVDPSSFVATATITGFNSPRYFLPVSNSKAYVTDIHANGIAVVNLSTNTITGSIHCPGWTEELVLAYGKAYVTNETRDKVYVIDTSNDQITDSITVSMGGNSIVADANGKLWVMCSSASSKLYRIDPVSMQVEELYTFPNSSDSPWRLNINSGSDTLYYLNKDVYRMPISASALPGSPFVATDGRNLYGIGVEPNSGVVYVADAIDYVQRGTVYRYKADGSLINSFQAGIIPGEFCFQ